jgi:2-polyprenyl-3-methyl-5-hydroxy-6-metoxy-1,4-benzoquinol methylase
MSVDQKVRDHFQADAPRFDAIYDDRKGPLGRFIDNVWRGVVRRRLELTVKLLAPLEGKRLLDVGCGSGRFCLAYAQGGARNVVGVDFAGGMIELARSHAQRLGVADRCDFRVGAFPDAVPDGPFDAATAMGFFDYIAEPLPLLKKMRALTSGPLLMSFPKAHEWRVPFRRLRFWLKGCPLFLYSEEQVRQLLADLGAARVDWHPLDRDYLVVAHS